MKNKMFKALCILMATLMLIGTETSLIASADNIQSMIEAAQLAENNEPDEQREYAVPTESMRQAACEKLHHRDLPSVFTPDEQSKDITPDDKNGENGIRGMNKSVKSRQ